MVNNTDCGPNSTFKKCSLKVEADRNSASVSAPKVGKWPLSAEFRFRPKAASYLSVFLRFRPKLTLTFGHQPKIYLNFRNATLVLRLLGLARARNGPERTGTRSGSSNATVSAFRFVETDYMS